MKHSLVAYALGAGCMAIVLSLSGCGSKDKSETSRFEPINVATPLVDSITLYRTYPGTLSATNYVDIVARVSGTLESINVDAGANVRKGQILYTIESTKYRNAVEQAEAALATAKSENTYAANRYAAMKKALESDAVSQMEVIQAKSTLEESEAAIKNAEAALQTARTNLGYCLIRAPFDGTVTTTDGSVGAYINGEVSPVTMTRIFDNSKLFAYFAIEDASFIRMFNNANNRHLIDYSAIPINFSDTLPHTYTADLAYIAPDVATSTGTLQLRAVVDNPYGELRDGMYATISLPYKVEPKALLIPDASIGTDQLGKYVYLVNDSNQVVYTPIKIGDLVQDTLRVVEEGMTAESRYVTQALLKVRDGMKVQPIEKK